MYRESDDVQYLLSCFQNPNVESDISACRRLTKKALQLADRSHDTKVLFPSVVKCLASSDLILKKLSCWFIVHHAREPDLILLAINTLVKDCSDSNPMVRGLALRTISDLPQESLAEYIVVCLVQGLKDQSSYVRRIAAIACSKLHHLSAGYIQDHGLVDTLYAMIRDPDPVVVVNCLVALQEILREEGGVIINRKICHFLLGRLDGFPDWQLAVLLDLVTKYKPKTEDEALEVMNLIDPYVKSNNASVVIATLKYFLHLVEEMPQLKVEVYQRAKPQVVHFLGSGNAELTYVLLEYIDSLLVDDPQSFSTNYKSFFCKYNEPLYVKQKKLGILPKLTREDNLADILDELNMYCLDVEEAVGMASVRAIGYIAERFPDFFEACINKVLQLLSLRLPQTTEQVLAVLQRLELGRYGDISGAMCRIEAALDSATTDPAKCSLVWLLGEYGEHLDEAPYVIERTMEDSREEDDVTMRLTLLTSCTKLFLKRPAECQEMLGQLFEACLASRHVQVRDKTALYYNLLRADVRECRRIVLESV